MQRPPKHLGMRHLALSVSNLESCVDFYQNLIGMEIEWQPDDDNVYLTSGNDNLALHRIKSDAFHQPQRLDHLGFFLGDIDDVDQWYEFLLAHNIEMKTKPRTHRDGARSFYCYDPAGNSVQIIFHPPIVNQT